MAVYELLTYAILVILSLAATAAIFAGLLNWAGAFYVVRCAACHHLAFSSINEPQPSCPHCRHPELLHPIYTAQHGRALRVVGDRLHY